MTDPGPCPLCGRNTTKWGNHHLVPESRGGKETIDICKDCHGQIHALFDNKRLERDLNTVVALKAEPQFAKYLKWVRKRGDDHSFKKRRSNRSRRRGRSG